MGQFRVADPPRQSPDVELSRQQAKAPKAHRQRRQRSNAATQATKEDEARMSDVMIQVENLTKDYGPTRAVDKVTFNVRKGEVLGFLGPNGAGKSTTMKILTCFLSPTAGRARVAGFDVFDDSLEVRKRIG